MNKTEERNLTSLRNSLPGKICICIRDEQTRQDFIRDAKAEGYRFGTEEPSTENVHSVVVLKGHKQLAHITGIVPHIQFQCANGKGRDGMYHKIDYAKYKTGNKKYYYVDPRRNRQHKREFPLHQSITAGSILPETTA